MTLFAAGRVFAYVPSYQPLSLPESEETRGIGRGLFRFLPSVDFSTYYDSNVYFSPNNDTADYYFLLKPSLEIKMKASKIESSARYSFYREQYFRQSAQSANSHLVNGDITLLPKGRLSAVVNGSYDRSPDLADTEIVERVMRVQESIGGRVSIRNTTGILGASAGYTYFTDNFAFGLADNDRRKQLITFDGNMRFLPKTQATISFNYEGDDYPNNPGFEQRFFRWLVGISGLMTARMNVSLKVGMSLFYPELSGSEQTFLTVAVINETFTANTSVRVGYMRESQSSSISAGKTENHGLFYFDHRFNRRLESQLRFDYYHIQYGVTPGLPQPRDDQLVRAALRFNVLLHPKIKGFAEYNLETRGSNARNPVTGSDSADFLRQQAGLGFTFSY